MAPIRSTRACAGPGADLLEQDEIDPDMRRIIADSAAALGLTHPTA